jgi:hypothetical protein
VIRRTLSVLVLVGVGGGVGCGEAFVAEGPTDGSSDGSRQGGGDASLDAPADSGTDTPVATDGGSDVASDAGPPWSPICPTDQPKVGSTCVAAGAVCEYPIGAKLEYDVSCDLVLECTKAVWTRDTEFNTTTCELDLPNSSSCPLTYTALTASPDEGCSDDNLRCEYADHVCVCSHPLGGPIEIIDAGETWSCNPGAGCPLPRPRLGATCSTANQVCTYVTCEFQETCLDGSWQGEAAACATAGTSP